MAPPPPPPSQALATPSSAGARAAIDPFGGIARIGTRAERTIVGAMILAMALHGAAAARTALIPVALLDWSSAIRARVHDKLVSEVDVEVAKPKEPEPEPPKEEEKEPPKAAPPPVAKAEKEPPPDTPPPAPAAAQAGAALVAEPDPNEPVDLTNTVVTGTGTSYAGGTTERGGTSTTAVRNAGARADGVQGGTGTAPAVAGPDRSRAPERANQGDMNCPWPAEADAAQVEEAYVSVRVSVGTDGVPAKVEIMNDPGYGFAREARRCAQRETFRPALDREGKAVAGSKVLRIHFEQR
ncbi:MAG: energy transducer TonB [Polyangiaceae bacterium]